MNNELVLYFRGMYLGDVHKLVSNGMYYCNAGHINDVRWRFDLSELLVYLSDYTVCSKSENSLTKLDNYAAYSVEVDQTGQFTIHLNHHTV